MGIHYKEFMIDDQSRNAFVYTPDKPWDYLTKPSSITILRNDAREASVKELLSMGLTELADKYHIILVFPNPTEEGWNTNLSPDGADDLEFLKAINQSIGRGIIGKGWGIMHDVRYLVGLGEASAIAAAYTSLHPEQTAALALLAGGTLPDSIVNTENLSMPSMLINCSEALVSHYKRINNTDTEDEVNDSITTYIDSTHPFHQVTVVKGEIQELTATLVYKIWYDLFYKVRRINTSPMGNICRRINFEACRFITHLNDTILGDNHGAEHTWIEHVPQAVLDNPTKPAPLLIFSHGATDNPMKAADMSKWHEIGEREGFITVYPLATNGVSFNLNLDPDLPSDVEFYLALIDYIKNKYNIDDSRVYLSGFSNGAGMSQVMAMLYPQLFAAIAPIDTMWPYVKAGPFDPEKFDLAKNLRPIEMGLELQRKYNYRMPVWYFYGTREMEYPIYKGLGQQYQYDAWKEYNNIPVKATPEEPLDSEYSIGVVGDEIEVIYPCTEDPEYKYSIHKYYSVDDRKNYYNIALAHGKGHDVHYVEAELAWQFISRFSRNPDGSLNDSKDSI
ncbi:MAG: alpha/beta hydrolase [Clostridiales bacterium]|nr:alpha/beta hydrolase [Clostridiales bacterium]